MVTSQQALKKYGDPFDIKTEQRHFKLWIVPAFIQLKFSHVRFSALGTIGFPKKIYLNNDFKPLLEKALQNLIDREMTKELKTWDGVFEKRTKRGLTSISLHSWAIAVDVNASENKLGAEPKLSLEFVKCFTDAGMDWGGTWKRKDGMHFQIANI